MYMAKDTLKKYISNILIVFLIILGAIAIFSVPLKNQIINMNVKQFSIENMTKEQVKENHEKLTELENEPSEENSFDFESISLTSLSSIVRLQLDENNETVAKDRTMGAILIPSVGIDLPIFFGVTDFTLSFGAGTMKQDQVMGEGNYSLASHRSESKSLLFRPLEHVEINDLIYITDLEQVYIYSVSFKEIVNPESTYLIEDIPDRKMITLVTCDDARGTRRLVIQGELIETVEYHNDFFEST